MLIRSARPDGKSASRLIIRSWGLTRRRPSTPANRAPFDAAMCALVEELKPEVVSFHFGLPDQAAVEARQGPGCTVIAARPL